MSTEYKRLAINGLGRIGRMVLRHYMDARPKEVELVAANDLVPTNDLAYLETTWCRRSYRVHRLFHKPGHGR
jgi:glyceraldehyde-3-phosphate dehydrogenase/erythrose-4-phosphate dehydrogenase